MRSVAPKVPKLLEHPSSFQVDRFGIVHGASTGVAMNDPVTRGLALVLCTGSRPRPIGRNDVLADRSNHDLLRFLQPVFDGPYWLIGAVAGLRWHGVVPAEAAWE